MSESFEQWLLREMPAGTVIGDPLWWAPKIRKALQHSGEPVAWRLRRDGVDYGITVYDKAQVGRYMQDGWQLVGELYTTPQPVVDVNQQLVEDKYEKLEPALEALVDLCNNLNIGTYDEVIAAEAALERLYLARKALLSAGKEADHE
jgi:hypothetical protein